MFYFSLTCTFFVIKGIFVFQYTNLDEEGIHTAKALGITEMNAIRMITGKSITVSMHVTLRCLISIKFIVTKLK